MCSSSQDALQSWRCSLTHFEVQRPCTEGERAGGSFKEGMQHQSAHATASMIVRTTGSSCHICASACMLTQRIAASFHCTQLLVKSFGLLCLWSTIMQNMPRTRAGQISNTQGMPLICCAASDFIRPKEGVDFCEAC